MPIQALPKELLILVFQNLPRRDLEHCLVVCKLWSPLAKEKYLSELIVSRHNRNTLIDMLCDKDSTNGTSASGDTALIKTLTIRNCKNDMFWPLLSCALNLTTINFVSIDPFKRLCVTYIVQLLAKSHRIQDIKIPRIGDDAIDDFDDYDDTPEATDDSTTEARVDDDDDESDDDMENDDGMENQDDLSNTDDWDDDTDNNDGMVHHQGNMGNDDGFELANSDDSSDNEEDEEENINNEVMERYFSACYQLRTSITHLRMHNLNQIYTIDNQVGNCFQLLDTFQNLTHLYLYNSSQENGIADLDMATILESHLRLVSLTYHSDHNLSDTPSSYSPRPRNNITLKTLDLQVPLLKSSHIRYITSSTQLDTFNLRMTGKNLEFDEWINGDDDGKTVMELAHHLSSTRSINISQHSLCVKPLWFQGEVPPPLSEARVILDSEITKFWMFVNALLETRPSRIKVKAQFQIIEYDTTKVQSSDNIQLKIINSKFLELSYVFYCPYSPQVLERDLSSTLWDLIRSRSQLHYDQLDIHIGTTVIDRSSSL